MVVKFQLKCYIKILLYYIKWVIYKHKLKYAFNLFMLLKTSSPQKIVKTK